MQNRLTLTITGLVCLCISGFADITQPSVLTDNQSRGKASNFLPAGTSFIKTGASAEWINDGKFGTDPETLKTGADTKRLFDGNNGENWKSRTYGKWNGGSWASIVIDLHGDYLVQSVDVWRLHEKTRDTESADILFSMDGKEFTIQGVAKDGGEVPYGKNAFLKISKVFEKPVLTRYIQVRMKRRKGAKQQQIGEIVVWGRKLAGETNYLKADEKPAVEFTVKGVQSGVVLLDWSSFPFKKGDVKEWRVYSADKPFERVDSDNVRLVKTLSAKATKTAIYPLKPEKQYYFGVSAVYKAGVNPAVKSVAYKTPAVVECNTLGDMLAINHFWGGGGSRPAGRSDAWEAVALDLLAQTPVKQIRWWEADPKIIQKYYAKGIGLLTYPQGNNIPTAAKFGVDLIFSGSNEPDLSGKPIETYLAILKKNYARMKEQHPDALMTAPSSGMEDFSIEWLRKFYELGGKEFFDVLDLHTYTKIAGGHKVPEGYPAGAPEALFDNMRKIREVTDAFKDSAKPVISTEFGYTNCKTDNPSGKIDLQTQAQYLVRGLIIHYALGFKRVFVYSFWDEGTDPDYTEHHFGMLDADLQKKPSFFAFCNLDKQLGKCVLLGKVEKLSPGFGYHFQDKETDNYVTVMWNGSGASLATFKTDSPSVTVTDMLGKTQRVIVGHDKTFKVVYDGSPVYVRSKDAIVPLACEPTTMVEQKDDEVTFDVAGRQIVQSAGKKVKLNYSLANNMSIETDTCIKVCTVAGSVIVEKKQKLKPGVKEQAAIEFAPPSHDSVVEKYLLSFTYTKNHASFSENLSFMVRFTQDSGESPVTRKVAMNGTDHSIYTLSNPFLEASFDADSGARVLDLINKKRNSNQLNIDYEKIQNLENIPFAYGIWDKVNGQLKTTKYRVVKAEAGQLILEAETRDKLKVVKEWSLQGNKLILKLKVTNNSDTEKPVSFFVHPEYHVGGTGDSVTDVFLYPTENEVSQLPFWTGLGDKGRLALKEGWCGIIDRQSGEYLRLDFALDQWEPARVWFGNGTYNVEMQSAKGLKIAPGQSWETQVSWTMENDKGKDFDGQTE